MKGGLLCQHDINKSIQNTNANKCNQHIIAIKMINNYYSLSSVKQALLQYQPASKTLLPKYWKTAWDKGVYIKTVRNDKVAYNKISYNALTTQSLLNDQLKINTLRLFYTFELLNTNNDMFPPILLNDSASVAAGSAVAPTNKHIVSSDYRRDVISFSLSILDDQMKDEKYILKISNNDKYANAYKHEASIYEYMNMNVPNIVKYYNSGKDDNRLHIKIGSHTINRSFFDLPQEATNQFYIVLENTCDYYDYEDYVILTNDLDKTGSSFVEIYNKLMNVSTTIGLFFHGDFHNNNVKINKQKQVKLFDFDYSCVINKDNVRTNIIASNIQNYNLKYNNNLVFSKDLDSHFNIGFDFFHMFDIFRLWLSTSKTIKQPLIQIPKETSDDQLNNMIQTFTTWSEIITDNKPNNLVNIGWHEFFMDNYFYETIYQIHNLIVKENKVDTVDIKSKSNTLSVTSKDLKTMSVSVCDSIEVQNADLQSLEIDAVCNKPSSYVLISEKSLSQSLSIGGTINYKPYGKHLVEIDGKRRNRVVWSYRNQLFVRSKQGQYIKIKKVNIVN